MREIKFRAWDKGNKEMLEVENLHFDEYHNNEMTIRTTMYNDYFDTEDMILMQYTGIKDKNGTEIYEGDIISIEIMEGKKETAKVEYSENYAQYIITSTGIVYLEAKPLSDFIDEGIKVIGNVYDNPDLLENIKDKE